MPRVIWILIDGVAKPYLQNLPELYAHPRLEYTRLYAHTPLVTWDIINRMIRGMDTRGAESSIFDWAIDKGLKINVTGMYDFVWDRDGVDTGQEVMFHDPNDESTFIADDWVRAKKFFKNRTKWQFGYLYLAGPDYYGHKVIRPGGEIHEPNSLYMIALQKTNNILRTVFERYPLSEGNVYMINTDHGFGNTSHKKADWQETFYTNLFCFQYNGRDETAKSTRVMHDSDVKDLLKNLLTEYIL